MDKRRAQVPGIGFTVDLFKNLEGKIEQFNIQKILIRG